MVTGGHFDNIGLPTTWACNCRGPQNGQPKCPCMMRNVIERDGRWIELERDLGPVLAKRAAGPLSMTGMGCICPAGAEKSCQGPTCPRKPLKPINASWAGA